ncbi:hypothetical protein [Fusobacterium sp. SYSU M8D902]|uniref:hypothetical protein n=1 Tax=Fusobacterium sp. SYSU M8D902 TaxID=3159562 RepID=UPI0032E46346
MMNEKMVLVEIKKILQNEIRKVVDYRNVYYYDRNGINEVSFVKNYGEPLIKIINKDAHIFFTNLGIVYKKINGILFIEYIDIEDLEIGLNYKVINIISTNFIRITIQEIDAFSLKKIIEKILNLLMKEKYKINYKNNLNLEYAGIIKGEIINTSNLSSIDRFINNSKTNHGIAAERANHQADFIRMKKVELLGDNNVKNGADRRVNGIEIQSKYCSTGAKCINECFDKVTGNFRYINSSGEIMQIEVPSDKYDEAVRVMKEKISSGKIPNVSDPNKATEIVRKGSVTYEQAKNITKFGTIDSIKFDAINGMVNCVSVFGLSACISFAKSLWDGDSTESAIDKAVLTGLKVGGVTFISSILSSQLSRLNIGGKVLNSWLLAPSKEITKQLGTNVTAKIANAFRTSKTAIWGGAATNNVAKMLRNNAIVGIATFTVLSSFDVIELFRGRISAAQLFKNMTKIAGGIAGGAAGYMGGVAAGAAIGGIVPIIGNVAGGIIGGLVGAIGGGTFGESVTDSIVSSIIEDDVKEMIRIIENNFTTFANNYLLNKQEGEKIVDLLKDKLTADTLKDMYSSNNRNRFAQNLIEPLVEKVVRTRRKIYLPSNELMIEGIKRAFNN